MLIHFIHGYYCIYRLWQPLTYLYFPYHCISLIYFSFTKIRMFLYAQIYWLAEFGDVSCLQFNYLRVETLTPTWEDFVGHLSDHFKTEVRQNSVSDLRVWSLINLGGICTIHLFGLLPVLEGPPVWLFMRPSHTHPVTTDSDSYPGRRRRKWTNKGLLDIKIVIRGIIQS
jgi:hypothetical protein